MRPQSTFWLVLAARQSPPVVLKLPITGCFVWSAWIPRGCFKLEEAGMAQGTVKWFNSVKGFGFIRPSDGSSDVFVHVTAVERAGMSGLAEGQKVSYDLATERGKTAAVNLKAV
jgi:CspA family cold shock protein